MKMFKKIRNELLILSVIPVEEESKSCIWIECVDEGRSTIGYIPCCKGTYKGANQ